ncbi:SHOCT domain-containing protein [Nonomuraea lactucae]|uniref:SHOCT domain-containing protein n=1 Tax=Nonomuraea lactucae TaxID=2249762 RepID=UPI001F06BF42|nr:SHOCT domain-containing protein [Nonomuraea lactucae]
MEGLHELPGVAMMCDMGAMGAATLLWVVGTLAVLALVAAATVWVVRSLTTTAKGNQQLPVDAAQEELRRRYVAGEIEREEFLQRKVDLES